jgi:hypothetical protein
MHTHSTPSLQRLLLVSLAALAVAGLFQNVIGNTERDNGDFGYFGVMLLVNAALGAWLFLRVIPRAIEAGPDVASRKGAIMGGLSIVSVAAFWIGIPFTMGSAAAVLGLEARKRGGGRLATVAVVLGVLAFLAATGVTIADEFATND